MSKQKRKNKLKKVVMFIICAFSIFLSTFSIFSTYPVSYTHLRAHETGRNLVCRLLLEKKKKKKKSKVIKKKK